MSVDIFAASKEIAEELEFVARWACAGDDIFDLSPSIERIASFLPFFQRCITDVWTAAADNDLLARSEAWTTVLLNLNKALPKRAY